MTTLQSRASAHHSHHDTLHSKAGLSQKPDRPSAVRRSKTYDKDLTGAGPWQHMAQTYAWVVEQEFVRLEKRNKKTEQWVLEQQILLDGTARQRAANGAPRRKMWEEMTYIYEVEAEKWMMHEERARRIAAEREKEKARLIQEEIRRIETRIRHKREAEKRRIEEKRRANVEHKEREKRERAKAEKATVDAWRNYEARWAALATASEPLAFSDIPWPLISSPSSAANITCAGIVLFLFSPLHSQTLSRKDRIRSAQLRWHPDRFQRLIGKVAQDDRTAVEEGVGIVARCLNDLMARETNASRFVR